MIPRPETETLLNRTGDRARSLPVGPILDCGTGSGILAIGLSRRTDRELVATDVSREALAVAQRNNRLNGTDASFVRTDRLNGLSATFAGIVANLPYVLRGSSKLEERVREHEPEEALLVPGEPDAFYREFVHQSLDRLHPDGELWMELDDELLERVPFREFVVESPWTFTTKTDSSGRPRFLVLSADS